MDALTTPAKPRAYRAFVSYSHADTAAARWVQKAVESYRVPRQLRRAAIHPLPERLYPVYRDRLDMRVGQDLQNSLLEALTDSDALIVVCSPAAVQSPWVDLEIRTFISTHPGSPVLAVIAAGEPGDGPESCFPAALLERHDSSGVTIEGTQEPVAADLRPGGDGKRMARLKLVAGLIDVSLVQLARRDDQRRLRRAAVLAVAALIVAALLAVALVRAVQAQREAERQRAAAEGLVEFMVGDLRTRLDPLGKLSILDAVGGRALRYYQGQPLGMLQPSSLARRARVLRLLGEIQSEQGNFAAATAYFRASADSTARVLALAPNDGTRIFEHAQSVYWLGDVAVRQRRMAEAEQAFNQYRDLAERLVRIDPANAAWRAEKGYAYSNLGTLLFEQGRNAQAEAAFRRALDISEVAARGKPADQQLQLDLAQSHGWLADTVARRGNYAAALAERDAEIAIYARLMAPGGDSKPIEYYRINTSVARSRLEVALGRLPEAIGIATTALADAKALAASDRRNLEWGDLVAVVTVARAQMLADAGRTGEATSQLDEFDRMMTTLPPGTQATPVWLLHQAKAQLVRSDIAARLGDPAGSLAAARATLAAIGPARADETRDLRLIRGRAVLRAADDLAALGQDGEAVRMRDALSQTLSGTTDDAELRALTRRAADRTTKGKIS